MSDFEDVTLSTDSNNPTIMPYDGELFVSAYGQGTDWNSSIQVYIKPSGNPDFVMIANNVSTNVYHSGTKTITSLVKKGDAVYVRAVQSLSLSKARFYKKRDYSNR